MPLSRLENFIKNVEGTILYVNPTDQDATDSIENQGNSLTRPFKTIQRALIEAARFSFVAGKDNDKFDKTTIIVYPGVHKIDNRPGLSIDNNGGSAEYKDRFGNVVSFSELTSSSNFDIEDSANVLHYFNSVSGGVIIPRGTSLVGMDLRKTKIFPMFVPDPQNSEIDNTAIFKVTGGCYFWQFSLFDGDPNGTVYKNYSTTRFTPNFSHHKLTCFEYADGNNTISLGAVTGGSAITNDNTDLDSYYFKVANAYGASSGRSIPSWPTNEVLQPKLAENQIVGAVQSDAIGITSVFSTNQTDYTFSGAVGRNIVVTTTSAHNLNVGTPIIVSGITTSSTATSNDPTFNAEGGTVVAEVLSSTQFAFVASEDTVVTNPHLSGNETVQVEPDTVTGASPYIFNLSLRSVYGVNGLHADGSKATGFKSMVLAQFTGIGLQKDDNAFLLYNDTTGTYNDTTTVAESEKPLHINSRAIYKPDYETAHVKTSNGAILQCVSIFAIGFSKHFVAESGGDQSITNSNSNFGAKALIANGFRDTAFARDNSGYITHIIPPKSVTADEESNFWVPLNVGLTTEYTVGSGTSDRLYTFGYTDPDVPPTHIIDQFRIGSKVGDQLKLEVNNVTQTADIIMEGSSTATNQKISFVNKNTAGTANSITESSGSIFGLTGNHEFDDGETVTILSDDGNIPDGIELDQKYFVIKTGLSGDQIKLAKTFNEAVSGTPDPIKNVNTTGGSLRIISAVSDKFPGDPGHPLQYDDTRSNWYINVKGDSTNKIYEAIENSTSNVTSKSFISRKSDNRNLEDRIYKIRYVIPKEFQNAKPPAAGYVIQESSSTIVENNSEYSGSISNLTDFRNLKIIHNVDYDSNAGVATVTAELPHRLLSGAKVKLNKVSSTNNTSATAKKGFNGIFDVANIVDSKTFTVNIPSGRNPGSFLNNRPASVTDRDENHPNFSINEYSEVYYIYRVNEISEYQQDTQDGIYHLTCLLGSVNPSSSYFIDRGFSQNVVNLYPMLDRDNYEMDPSGALSIASNKRVSEVTTNDLTQSITKEFVNSLLTNNRYGFNITDAIYDQTTGVTTVTTDVQHNLNSVINVSIADSGSGFGFSGVSTTIYNAKLTGGTGEGATIRFTTNTGGNFSLTSPIIVDGGSGYSVGDTLTVSNVGIPTFSGGTTGVTYSTATLTVSSINQATNNSIQIEDVINHGEKNNEFNGVFRILDVPTSKKVSLLLPPSNSGIGTFKKNGKFILAGSLSTITSIEYTDATTGIVTVTCDRPHGFNIGNSFKIDYNDESSLTSSIYNGTFTVNERVGLNTFTFYIGQGISPASAPSNVGYVLPTGYTAQEADSDASRENIFRRMNSFYVGISTTINGALTKSSTTITLSNSSGFEKGDYIEIGTEIVRVKNTFSSNQADILRGLFGTRVAAISDGTLAKKIKPIPVEGRRYSILRASGHTFEYVGFGPGNYSNALPQRQDRILSKKEQLLSQSEKSNGGVVVYTGMNDSGDFYVGNRRLSSATGQEETIGIPVPRFVGDDGSDTRLSVVFDDVTVKEFIKVEGGAGNIITSEFNGPVGFSNKVNFNSDKGVDFKTITLKGTDADNTRRKYSVGISTPKADADNSVGDVVWKNDPVPGGYAGWIFAGEEGTEDNKWRKFGLIASEDAEQDTDTDSNINSPLGNFTILPSKIGINTNVPQSVIEVKDGNTRLDTLYVAGVATFIDSVTLGNVNIDDLTINTSLSVSGTVSVNASGGYTLCGNSNIIGLTTHTGDYDLVGGLQVENSASVGGTLTVSGNTDLNQNLQVSGNTSILGALSVSGITTLGNQLNVSGSLSLNGSSILSGAVQAKTNVSVGQDLNVNNNASVGGTLTVTGNAGFGTDLTVSRDASIGGTLTVSGNADLNKDLTVSGSTSLNGTLRVLGNTSLDDALTVSGPTTINNTLTVTGNAGFGTDLTVSGNASVGGNLNVDTNADVAGTLCVGGNTQLKGNTSIGGYLSVVGNTSLDNDLTVSGDTLLKSTLRVIGNTSLDNSLTVSGPTVIKNTLTVTGNAGFGTDLTVSGNVAIGGTFDVSGESDFRSKLNANQISASGQITSDQQVQADNQVTAGEQVIAGADVIAGGTLQVASTACVGGDTQLKSNVSVGQRLDVNGQTSIGGNLKVSNDGDANIEIRSNLSGVPHIDFARSENGVSQGFNARLILRGDDQFDISGANVRIGQNLEVAGSTSLDDALTVSGPTTIKNTLTVSGNTDLNQNLQVSGNTDIGGYLNVGAGTTLQQTLFVSGNASIGGTLCVEGKAFFNNDIDISGNTLYTGRIDVSGDAMLNRSSGITTTRQLDVNGNLQASGLICAGTLRVAGTTSLENLDVNGSASFASSVQIAGNTSVGGVLNVPGTASIGTLKSTTLCAQGQAFVSANLRVFGTTTLSGAVQVKTTLSVGGDATLARAVVTGNLSVGGTFSAAGGANIGGDVTVSSLLTQGRLQAQGNLCVAGITQLKDDLNVSGATTLNSTLTVFGSSDFQSKLNANDISASGQVTAGQQVTAGADVIAGQVLRAGGSLCAQAQAFVNQDLLVASNTQLNGNASVGGNLTVAGGLTLGTLTVTGESEFQGKINANTISASGQVIVDQQVQADGSGLFGQTLRAGGSLCAQAQAFVNQDLRVAGNTTLCGTLTVSGESEFQSKMNTNNISSSGSLQVQGQISTNASVRVGQNLDVSGNASVRGNLSVGGDATLARAVVTGNLSVGGTFSAAGSANIGGDVTVSSLITTGRLQSQGNLSVDGNSQLKGNTFIGGTLEVTGQVQAKSSVSVNGTLRCFGNLCAQGSAFVNGALQLGSELDFIGGSDKYIDMMLVSSDLTTFTGNIRSMNHNSQGHETHIAFGRNEGVCFFYNNDRKAETTDTGFYVSGTLSVTNNANVANQLFVGDQADVSGQISAGGSIIAGQTLRASGYLCADSNAYVSGILQVTGESEFQSKLSANQISASGQVIVDQQVQADGSILAGQTLRAGGNLCGQGNAFINGTLRSTGEVQANGSLIVGQTLRVGGTACLQSTTVVNGALQTRGDIDFIGAKNKFIDFMLVSSNGATFNANFRSIRHDSQGHHYHIVMNRAGAVDLYYNNDLKAATRSTGFYVSGTLSVTSQIIADGAIVAGQTLRAGGNLCADGNVYVSGALQVTGASEFQSKISANQISASGQVIVDQQIQADGSILAGQTLRAGGNLCADGNVYVSGALQVTGASEFQSKISANDISASGQIQADGSILAGQTLRASGNLCADGNAYVSGALQVTAGTQLQGGLTVVGTTELQGKLNANDICTSGLVTICGGLTVKAGSDFQAKINANDISASGNLEVKGTAYLSGTTQLKGNASVGGRLDIAGDISFGQFKQKPNAFMCRHFGNVNSAGQVQGVGSQVGGTRTFNVNYNSACTGKYTISFKDGYKPDNNNYSVNVTGRNNQGDHVIEVDQITQDNFRVRGLDTGLTGGSGNDNFDNTAFMFSVFY